MNYYSNHTNVGDKAVYVSTSSGSFGFGSRIFQL